MKKIICLDPGHGQPWPGAVYGNIIESDFVLEITKVLAAELQRRDYLVVKTRHARQALYNDSNKLSQDLRLRSRIANTFNADIFISLHFNSYQNHTANGVETWYFHQSREGKRLAGAIQQELVKNFPLRDRGVKGTSKFIVLKETVMPAVLIELGFITNNDDREVLINTDYPQKVAKTIVDGIDKYYNG